MPDLVDPPNGFRWADPPIKRGPGRRKGQPSNRDPMLDVVRLLVRCDERPGQWARLRKYATSRGAELALRRLRGQGLDEYQIVRRAAELYGRRRTG